jgi:lipopolysaccharide export system permease protein
MAQRKRTRLPPTMSLYLAKLFTVNFLSIFGILLAIVYLFSTMELLRQASKVEQVSLAMVLRMGLYKLPDLGQTLLPFAILFGAMFTFWILARRHELVVVRGAGFSVWQFLAPILMVAAATGVIQCMILNPISATMLARYDALEAKYFMRDKGIVTTLFDRGIWLRQVENDDKSYMIVHAEKIVLPQWQMNNVMALFFDSNDNLTRRVDSSSARLGDGDWVFDNAQVYQNQKPVERSASISLPTNLTRHEIEESFSSARSQSFWRLPGYIKTLTETGFDATRLRIHFQALLAEPVLFLAMVLLAASVSMRPPRFQRSFDLIAAGVVMGFLVFFVSSFLQALGASQQIPVILAAWSPALVSLLLGVTVILSLEDG